VTTPITAPMVPLGPDLAPGRADATGMDGFAALLGQLVTMVAGAPAGQPTPGTPTEQWAPTVPDVPAEVVPEAAAVACAAGLSGAVAAWPAPALAPGAGATTAAEDTSSQPQPGTRPDIALPTNASPKAHDAVLRHGPAPAATNARADRAAQDPAPALFAAVAERAALPAQLQPLPPLVATPAAIPAASTAVAGSVAAAPEEAGEVSDVPVATAAAQGAAAPAPLPTTASERAVERTENVRPAILEAARGLRQEGDGRVSLVVRLNPPELGSVLVRLTVQDGRVDVQLRTPDLHAVGDLSAQLREVQQVLKDSGFDLSSFDVAHGGVHDERGDGKTPDRGTTQRDRPADGRREAPHVTDDVPDARPAGTWL